MSYFWIENKEDKNSWLSNSYANIFVSHEYFFNNSNIILDQYPDFTSNFKNLVSSNINITPIIRKKTTKYYKGIDITELNKSLRYLLSKDSQILFEVYNNDGVFYTSNSKSGFDFAYLDRTYNLIQLWNLCFGRRSLYDGKNHWCKSLNDNDFIKSEYESSNNEHFKFESFEIGKDIKFPKSKLTILGELQFGNWGLAYRDLFKLLQADASSGVDLFVYVTAHNNLLSYASDNIVSYQDTIKILNEFSNLIKVPIWVIGLDIQV